MIISSGLKLAKVGPYLYEISRIVYIKPDEGYTKVYFNDIMPVYSTWSLKKWNEHLCETYPTIFYRIGDSAIINKHYLLMLKSPNMLFFKMDLIQNPKLTEVSEMIITSDFAFKNFKAKYNL
jgi:hypothetical protein